MDKQGRVCLGLDPRPCVKCGTVFQPADTRTLHCSLSCRFRKVWPPPSKPCEMCGKIMVKPTQGMSYEAWESRRFCSKQCMGKSYRRPAQPCRQCGVLFHPVSTRGTVYCSKECYHERRRVNPKGPREKLARQRRRAPFNFTDSQKKALMKRAGHACEKCGSTRHLEVDHVIPVMLGGTNVISNGQVLCRACHWLKTDAERKANPLLVWRQVA